MPSTKTKGGTDILSPPANVFAVRLCATSAEGVLRTNRLSCMLDDDRHSSVV